MKILLYLLGENWPGLSSIMTQVSNVVPRVFLNINLPLSYPQSYSVSMANSLLLEDNRMDSTSESVRDLGLPTRFSL